MKIKAIYEDNVLKPLDALSLPEKSEVRLTINIKRRFSDLLDEWGEPEAKEDIDLILGSMRQRSYYE